MPNMSFFLFLRFCSLVLLIWGAVVPDMRDFFTFLFNGVAYLRGCCASYVSFLWFFSLKTLILEAYYSR